MVVETKTQLDLAVNELIDSKDITTDSKRILINTINLGYEVMSRNGQNEMPQQQETKAREMPDIKMDGMASVLPTDFDPILKRI